jgi:excinuclease ABC subunit C
VREALEAVVEGKVVVVAARYENERAWIGMAENNAGLALLVREQESSRGEQRLEALRDALSWPRRPSASSASTSPTPWARPRWPPAWCGTAPR